MSDLYLKFGKKRYPVSSNYFNSLRSYIKQKNNPKDLIKRLDYFMSDKLSKDETMIFISSLITHTMLIGSVNGESDVSVSDLRTLIKLLDDLVSGDFSGLLDLRNDFLNNI